MKNISGSLKFLQEKRNFSGSLKSAAFLFFWKILQGNIRRGAEHFRVNVLPQQKHSGSLKFLQEKRNFSGSLKSAAFLFFWKILQGNIRRGAEHFRVNVLPQQKHSGSLKFRPFFHSLQTSPPAAGEIFPVLFFAPEYWQKRKKFYFLKICYFPCNKK